MYHINFIRYEEKPEMYFKKGSYSFGISKALFCGLDHSGPEPFN